MAGGKVGGHSSVQSHSTVWRTRAALAVLLAAYPLAGLFGPGLPRCFGPDGALDFAMFESAAHASGVSTRELKKRFDRVMRDRNPAGVARFVKAAAKVDDPLVASLLVRAAVSLPSFRNYERALRAIAKYRDEKTIGAVIEFGQKSKNYAERVLIVEALGRRVKGPKSDEVRSAVHQALREDASVHVRVAAIMVCADRKERQGIPVLIEHLGRHEKARNRDWIERRQALLELTGEDFQLVEDWRNFWAANKDTFDPEDVGKKPRGKTARARVARVADSAEFFGEEIHSENVVFVIDCSGSMRLYDRDANYDGDEEERDRERMRRAKTQTVAAIRHLPKKARFNVIAFNSEIRSWKKRLTPATHGSIKKAGKFLDGLEADSMTHTLAALEEAFRDPGVDTVVLLSDGVPFKEGMGPDKQEAYAEKILKRVKDLNAGRNLKIDAFGFEGIGREPGETYEGGGKLLGGRSNRDVGKFLKKLARRNDGIYKSIK